MKGLLDRLLGMLTTEIVEDEDGIAVVAIVILVLAVIGFFALVGALGDGE
jgi:hypothetical protein